MEDFVKITVTLNSFEDGLVELWKEQGEDYVKQYVAEEFMNIMNNAAAHIEVEKFDGLEF